MTQAALAVALDVSRKAINEREAGGTITREAAMAISFLALGEWLIKTLTHCEQTAIVKCMTAEVNRRMKLNQHHKSKKEKAPL